MSTLVVKRVHWLRARAQYLRWKEELTLLTYEMTWVVQFFQHMRGTWSRHYSRVLSFPRAGTGEHVPGTEALWKSGAAGYAQRQIRTWSDFAAHAERVFRATYPKFTLTHPGCGKS